MTDKIQKDHIKMNEDTIGLHYETLANYRLLDITNPRDTLVSEIDNMHLQKVEILRNWH